MEFRVNDCATFSSDAVFYLDAFQIPAVDHYKYLGVPFNQYGIDQEMLLSQVKKKVNSAYWTMFKIGFHWNEYCIYNASNLLKTFITSITQYFLPFFSSTYINKLQSIVYQVARRYFNTKKTVSRVKLFCILGIQDFKIRHINALKTNYRLVKDNNITIPEHLSRLPSCCLKQSALYSSNNDNASFDKPVLPYFIGKVSRNQEKILSNLLLNR